MALTPALFRQQFSAFSDPGIYTDEVIDLWIGVAGNLLNATRWGNLLDYGTGLFVAHHVALDRRDEIAAEAGGIPGQVVGPETAKSVDKVSISRDAKSVTLAEDAGTWNMTRYGIRLLQLSRLVGAGGVQVGTCGGGGSPSGPLDWYA